MNYELVKSKLYRFKALTFILLFGFFAKGCELKDISQIKDDVYIEKENNCFNIIFDKATEYELKFNCVDSFTYSSNTGYQFIVYGQKSGTQHKMWYYIAGAPKELKKSWGGWYDLEFRKYRLNEIDRKHQLYITLVSAAELWISHR